MTFEQFKNAAAAAARHELGEGSRVAVEKVRVRGGAYRPVLRTAEKKRGKWEETIVFLDDLYEEFQGRAPGGQEGNPGTGAAMEEVLDLSGRLPAGISCWEDAKGDVYPLLLPGGRIPGLEGMPAPFPGCSLSVACALRGECAPQIWYRPVVITPAMAAGLGATQEDVYRAAMENLAGDGCHASSLPGQVAAMLSGDGGGAEPCTGAMEPGTQYVLTNGSGFWGAAALLDAGLLKRLSGGQSLYILPSSVHEVLLLVDRGTLVQDELDRIVEAANAEAVPFQEQLGTGSFYYDGKTGEIRRYREAAPSQETEGKEG